MALLLTTTGWLPTELDGADMNICMITEGCIRQSCGAVNRGRVQWRHGARRRELCVLNISAAHSFENDKHGQESKECGPCSMASGHTAATLSAGGWASPHLQIFGPSATVSRSGRTLSVSLIGQQRSRSLLLP